MSENKYIFNETQITDIADGTRKVTGTTEKMTVSEIAEKLNNYEAPTSGLSYMYLNDGWEGDVISEDITVVVPNAFSCKGYVDNSLDLSIFRKFGTIDLPSCTKGMSSSFQYTIITKSLNIPKLQTAGNEMFYGADLSSLTELNFPALTTAGNSMFNNADLSSITELNFPALTTAGNFMFSSADLSSITELNFPALTTAGDFMFRNADLSSLTELNFPALTTVGSDAFSGADLSSITEDKLNEFLCRTDLGVDSDSVYNGDVFFEIKTNASKLKCKWKNVGVRMFGQLKNADGTAKTTVKLWLSKDTQVIANRTYNGIFTGSTGQVDIYTDATSKPSNWGTYFNYLNNSTQATVHYGVSEAEYDAL